MIHAALVFLALGVLTLIFGFTGYAGLTQEVALSFLVLFLILSAITFTTGILTGKGLPQSSRKP